MSDLISCPKCQHQFAPTEEASKKIRAELEKKFKAEVLERTQELEKDFNSSLKNKLQDAKEKAYQEAKSENDSQVSELQLALQTKTDKLKEASAKEVELRKAQRELESAKEEFELTLQRKMDIERQTIKAEAENKLSDAYMLKEGEWKKVQADMSKQIEELRRKAEQGSQQLQGEVQELEVESTLKEVFPHDLIEPVAKGVKGGDVLQVVQTRGGATVGSILWEIKRTKNFSDSWISKLKDNQRSAKAEVAVIITTVLPDGVKHIGQIDSVWISDFQSFIGIALVLRASLLELAQAKQSQAGRKEKAEEVYDYLQGAEFKGRVQGLVESFVAMRDDLESERRAFEKIWSKRDKQIIRAMTSTAGFYGDLQGIAGSALSEIPQLALEVK